MGQITSLRFSLLRTVGENDVVIRFDPVLGIVFVVGITPFRITVGDEKVDGIGFFLFTAFTERTGSKNKSGQDDPRAKNDSNYGFFHSFLHFFSIT